MTTIGASWRCWRTWAPDRVSIAPNRPGQNRLPPTGRGKARSGIASVPPEAVGHQLTAPRISLRPGRAYRIPVSVDRDLTELRLPIVVTPRMALERLAEDPI
jgi:hypothetical protein